MSKKFKIGIACGIICLLLIIIVLCITLKSTSYTITFDSNGGTNISSQKIKNGENAIKPLDPEKDGYEFEGWYLDGEKFYFDSKITENIRLEAKWIKKTNFETVKVTFDTDGGSKISSVEVEIGKKIKKPTNPTKEGYVFVEWLLDNNSFNFDTEITSNIKLKASWKKLEEDSVTITFDSNNGSSVASQIVKKGEKATKPANPTRNGYTFNGWYLNNKKYDFNKEVNDNITLKANWTKNEVSQGGSNGNQAEPKPSTPEVVKYTVSFNSNGGSSVASQSIIAGGKATKPSDPVRNGYKFIGWMHNGGAYNFDSAVNGNVILVAEWEVIPVPDVYTVKMTLIGNDQSSTERKVIVYKNGQEITAKALLNGNSTIGRYSSGIGGIRVNESEYNNATDLKVKLNDESVVSATKI